MYRHVSGNEAFYHVKHTIDNNKQERNCKKLCIMSRKGFTIIESDILCHFQNMNIKQCKPLQVYDTFLTFYSINTPPKLQGYDLNFRQGHTIR